MKKKISMIVAGIAFIGMMVLNMQKSLNPDNIFKLNLKILSATADGEEEGCIAANSECVQTWWKCVNGDCRTETITFQDMTEYTGQ